MGLEPDVEPRITPPASFRLRLMGFPVVVAGDGTTVGGLGPGKPLGLLLYLAVRGEVRREELVDLLWGDAVEANARNAFRQALHRLRTALGDELIPAELDLVRLAPSPSLSIDRQDLISALDRQDVAAAMELYRGDFLEGFDLGEPLFDTWADAERVRLRARFQAVLQTGARASLDAGRWLEALHYVQRLTTIAPFDEDIALLEANVLVAAGRGTEAAVNLRRFVTVLHEQLDVSASSRVREMLSRIDRSKSDADAPT